MYILQLLELLSMTTSNYQVVQIVANHIVEAINSTTNDINTN